MRYGAFAFAACLTTVLLAGAASGQTVEESEKYVSVVQQKPFVKLHRVEVMPAFTVSASETLTQHVGVGATARFHITDEWAIAVDYVKYFGKLSQLATDIGNQYEVLPEKRLADQFIGAHAEWVPIFGKFLVAGGPIVYWDAYLLAGIGVTRTVPEPIGWRPTGNLGVGLRLALTKFMTLNIEGHYFVYRETYQETKNFVSNFAFSAGLGFFAPFSHEYAYPK